MSGRQIRHPLPCAALAVPPTPTSLPQPSPTPGMSFAFNISRLLPSEEGAPLHLSSPPLSLCHLGMVPIEHSGPSHFKPKKKICSFTHILGSQGWCPGGDHHLRTFGLL